MITKTEKQYISDSYLMIINEYFTKFIESELCSFEYSGSLNDIISYDLLHHQLNSNLLTGIMIINRVFEYTFIKTRNISSTYYYSIQALTYYLEYIEQIYKANLSQDINHSDAVFFVYKKTIFDLFDGDVKHETISTIELGGKSILSNIIQSISCENQAKNTKRNGLILGPNLFKNISNEEFTHIFLNITKITDILLGWKESFINKENGKPSYCNRIEFCQKFQESFLKDIEKYEYIIERLNIIHESTSINIHQWKELLKELIMEITKNKKNKVDNTNFTFFFYSNKDIILEKLYNNDYKYVVKLIVT